MYKNKINLEKLFAISIILLPFLYQYASPLSFLSLGDFCVYIVSFLLFIKDLNRNRRIVGFKKVFFIIIVLLSLNIFGMLIGASTYYLLSEALTIILKMIIYAFVMIMVINHFDFKYVKKMYLVLVFLFTIYLFMQVLYHKVIGGYLPIYIKYDWLFSWEQRPGAVSLQYYYDYVYYKFRPSSLFMEPGYYALYVLPALYITLIKGKKFILPVLITIGLVLSTSGAGILLGGFAWVMWILQKCFKIKQNYIMVNSLYLLLLFVVIFVLLIFVQNLNLFSKVFNSLNTRFYRGFIVFDKYDSINKLFGVGINNVETYMKYYNIHTIYDETNLNFGSTFTKSFMEYGIIGLGLFLLSILYVIKKMPRDYFVLSLLGLIFFYFLFEDMLFNFRMCFYFSFIVYYIKNANIVNCKKKKLLFV